MNRNTEVDCFGESIINSDWGDEDGKWCPVCESFFEWHQLIDYDCCPDCGVPSVELEDAVYNPQGDVLVWKESDRI